MRQRGLDGRLDTVWVVPDNGPDWYSGRDISRVVGLFIRDRMAPGEASLCYRIEKVGLIYEGYARVDSGRGAR